MGYQLLVNVFKIRPRQLLQVLTGAYGLTEGTRRWHLRARGWLAGSVTMTEPRCDRAVWTKHDSAGKLRVIWTLHVDDGLLLGTRSDPICPTFLEAPCPNSSDIKSWQDLDDPKEFDYLGLTQKGVPEGCKQTRQIHEQFGADCSSVDGCVSPREHCLSQNTGSKYMVSESCLASFRKLREQDGAES